MKSFKNIAMAALITPGFVLLAANGASASSYTCESGSVANWKTQDEARAIVEAQGYDVRKIKVEGGCYEFYVKKDGTKAEVFVNPATLKIVSVKTR